MAQNDFVDDGWKFKNFEWQKDIFLTKIFFQV